MTLADLATTDMASPLIRTALGLSALCHSGQRRDSDDAPFIEHPLEVAGLLRDAGCSDGVVAAGLLHELVETGDVSVAELTQRFGPDVARLVRAVSDDPSIPTYRQRKQALRKQVRAAGGDAALLFAADTIAKVRELPAQVRRDRARFDAAGRAHTARIRLERYHQLRLEHYHKTLRMLQEIAPRQPLVRLLAKELRNCPIAIRTGATERPT